MKLITVWTEKGYKQAEEKKYDDLHKKTRIAALAKMLVDS
jgi:hypothetical protein